MGYVSANYSVLEEKSVSGGVTVRIKNTRTVNVRTAPTTNSTVIEEADPNDTFTYLGQEGNWYKIRYSRSKDAYVSVKYSVLENEFGIVVQDLTYLRNSGGSSSGGSSWGSSSGSGSSSSSGSSYDVPVYGGRDCHYCSGGKVDCSNCSFGKTDCAICGGSGRKRTYISTPNYSGSGTGGSWDYVSCGSCSYGKVRCRVCNGSGEVRCRYCGGDGKL